MNGQKMFMIVDIDRCWGCKACQVACKREHGLASEDFKPIEVFRVENMQGDKVRCDFCRSPANTAPFLHALKHVLEALW